MVTMGLVGSGARGTVFAQYIEQHNECSLAGICDKDMERSRRFLNFIKTSPPIYNNHKDLVHNPNSDAVIIATTDYSHSEIAINSLKANKHVLCDKPPAININELNQVIGAVKENPHLIFMTDLVLRYNPFYETLILWSSKVGTPRLATVYDAVVGDYFFRRWHRLKANSGGPVLHEGIHSLDIMHKIIQRSAKRVTAASSLQYYRNKLKAGSQCRDCAISSGCAEYFDYSKDPLKDLYLTSFQQEGFPRDLCVFSSNKDTPDNVIATVEFEGGALLTYTLCLYAPIWTREIKLVGDEGMIIADSNSSKITFYSRTGIIEEIVVEIPARKYGGGDENLFNLFVESINKGETQIEAKSEFESTATALAIELSLVQKKEVFLEYDEQKFYQFQ